MLELDHLIEAFLVEAALSKGSQRVLSDKKLLAGLAEAMRDDVMSNPSSFPPGSKATFKKATDEALAEWFLENIDRIEREGYEGTVYSRDGVNNDWIVRRYIAGSHNWEDITGVMNMNLRDWYLLKNRNMLDANHKDLPKFNGVRDVGYYMTTHYKTELDKVRDAAKNAARNKMSKSIKLVDNDDYRIYSSLNRAASCALGLGTQWCTANSNYPGHYHSYSNRAMLFQVFPYIEKKNPETGEEELALNDNEKYQFDAGGPNFMDITDRPVRPEVVREKFPYLYDDLVKGLRANKSKIEKLVKDAQEDPSLQGDDYKVKNYNIDTEIEKLDNLKSKGYFTDEVRQKDHASEPENNQPQIGAPQEQPPQEPQMESIRDLARAMLEDVTLGHIVREFRPINATGEDSPLTYGDENLDEEQFDECGDAKARLAQALSGQNGLVDEDDMQDMDGEIGAQAATGGIGSIGSSGGGGQFPPGTAPTMPESIQQKGITMEQVDKDVAAMLNSLKKYDKLNESVLGMVTLSMAKPKVVEAGKPWEDSDDEKEEIDEETVDDFEKRGGQVEKLPYKGGKREKAEAGKSTASNHIGTTGGKGSKGRVTGSGAKVSTGKLTGDKSASPVVGSGKKKVDEASVADADILNWMSRFSKLGNMKGYGR